MLIDNVNAVSIAAMNATRMYVKPNPALLIPGIERISSPNVPALQTPSKPQDALLRSAMSERVGDYVTLTLVLQAVIAYGARGPQGLFNVSSFE